MPKRAPTLPPTGMATRTALTSSPILAIPVGGSVGALLGIDAHRAATGQKPLFTGGNNDGADAIVIVSSGEQRLLTRSCSVGVNA
jgi:hypothetical protein